MLRTVLLLGLLTGILLAIGFFWAGLAGLTMFFGIALAINFLSYWYSDKIVLKIYKAKPIADSDDPKLHSVIENLSKEAGIPKPRLYMVDMPVLNAFATGRNKNHAAVAITTGLMKHLNWDEIEGVLAHELSHVKNRDTLTSTMAATIAGAIGYIGYIAWWSLFLGGGQRGGGILMLPLILLAPMAAIIIQLAISRSREFAADKTGTLISKKPLALASALEKISHVAKNHPLRGNSATSHLFIINPFKADTLGRLFSTHPRVEERVRRLKVFAKELE